MSFALLVLLLACAPSGSRAASKRWNSGEGGNWFDATKWDPQGVPSSTDDVYITHDGTYVITHNGQSNINSIKSLGGSSDVTTGIQTLVMAGGIMTINTTSIVESTGVFQFVGGTVTTNSNAKIVAQGLVQFAEGNEKTLSGIQLEIRNSMTQDGGGIQMTNGAKIQVYASANMVLNSGAGITVPSTDLSDNAIINLGNITVAPDASAQYASIISCRIESSGLFVVKQGALTINSLNTTWTTILSVNNSAASVTFTIGTHIFATSSIIEGPGTLVATNEANMKLGGSVTIYRFDVVDGGVVIDVINNAAHFKSLYVKNGKISGPAVRIDTFKWEGGSVLIQRLEVTDLVVNGSDSRSLTGTVFSIGGSAYFMEPTEIFLEQKSILELASSATMVIDKKVAFMCQGNDTSVLKVGGTFNFTYADASQSTLVSCVVQIDNGGTFSVDKGSVNFGNKLTSSGTLHVAAGADASVSYQQASVMTKESTLIGLGSVTCISCDLEIYSHVVNIGIVQLPTGKINFAFDSGTAGYTPYIQFLNQSGSALIQMSNTARSALDLIVGSYVCNGGTIMSNQDTAFGSFAHFVVANQSTFSGGTAINLMNIAFVNQKLLTFAGDGPVRLYGSTTLLNTNQAQWIVTGKLSMEQQDLDKGYATTINNQGTMQIKGQMEGIIKLSNNGEIIVPQNGLINLLVGSIVQDNPSAEIVMQGGTITTANPLYIQSGVLRGFGTIVGDVLLTGEIRPQYKPSTSVPYTQSRLQITGNLQQRVPGFLTLPFFPNGNNTGGQLKIGSTYSLWGGSFKIANANFSAVVARAPPAPVPVLTYGNLVTSSPSNSYDSIINANLNSTTGLGVELGSNSVTINYAPVPVALSVSPASGNTRGSTTVTISGTNFQGSSVTVEFCGPRTDVAVVSENKITISTLPGTGNCSICVIVDGRGCVGGSNVTFRYDPPAVESISSLHGPTTGGNMITIGGTDFGASASSIRVSIGNSSCYNLTLIESDSKIACQAPGGIGTGVPISISVSDQYHVLKNFTYNYDSPVIDDICPRVGNVSGGVKLRIFGRNFAPYYPADISSYVSVDIAGKSCSDVKLEAIDEISCTTPQFDAPKDNNNQTTFKIHVTVNKALTSNDLDYRVFTASTNTIDDSIKPLYYLIYGISVALVFLLGLVLGVAFIHFRHKHQDAHHIQPNAAEYVPIVTSPVVNAVNYSE